MANACSAPATGTLTYAIFRLLLSFPITCFSLTIVTDIAYWQSSNLLWLHFSEWLLFIGVIFAILAAVAATIHYMVSAIRPSFLVVLGNVMVFLLAVLNNFIHTADGWTAVVPWGLTVSVVTVLVMIVTGCLSRRTLCHE